MELPGSTSPPVNRAVEKLQEPSISPSGMLLTRSPKTRRGVIRRESYTDLQVSVSSNWDLSPVVRRRSIVFSSPVIPRESRSIPKQFDVYSTLEDVAREGILKAAEGKQRNIFFNRN